MFFHILERTFNYPLRVGCGWKTSPFHIRLDSPSWTWETEMERDSVTRKVWSRNMPNMSSFGPICPLLSKLSIWCEKLAQTETDDPI